MAAGVHSLPAAICCADLRPGQTLPGLAQRGRWAKRLAQCLQTQKHFLLWLFHLGAHWFSTNHSGGGIQRRPRATRLPPRRRAQTARIKCLHEAFLPLFSAVNLYAATRQALNEHRLLPEANSGSRARQQRREEPESWRSGSEGKFCLALAPFSTSKLEQVLFLGG